MKKRIIKIVSILIFVMFLNITSITIVDAASAKVTINRSASTIVVGNNVTFTVTVNTDYPIGMWDYAASVSNNLVLVSSSSGYVSKQYNLPSNNTTKSITYKFTYRAKSSGNATFKFNLSNVYDKDENAMGITGTNSSSTNVITQAQLEASYSKNNNLSGLSVEGYNLSPTFNKNTLEYSVELPNGVTKIKVNASKEDGTASISGTGEITVTEGKNKLEIKVTAQNGSVKTYVINATVKELDPIIVKVNDKDFNIVRKKAQITAPNDTFKEKEIKINDLEVPAFENEKLGYTLVGLKDSEGTIELYIYNDKDNNYTKYEEYNFKSSIIGILDDSSKIPEGYIKSKVKINDKEITAYKIKDSSRFYLFYGVNVETGDKNLYVYDEKEKTIQRYNDNEVISIYEQDYEEKETIYQYIIIGLGSLLIITYLALLICLISNSKKKKRRRMQKMSKKQPTILDDEEKNNTEIENENEHEPNTLEDPLYEEVMAFVTTNDKISVAIVQRKFKLGINRATRLIEKLEKEGIIGPKDKTNYREVLLNNNKNEKSEEEN